MAMRIKANAPPPISGAQRSPSQGMDSRGPAAYPQHMKAEDLQRYQAMLHDIERQVGRFRLAFGSPGMRTPRRAGRPEAGEDSRQIDRAAAGDE
jgi:hypothetical protein